MAALQRTPCVCQQRSLPAAAQTPQQPQAVPRPLQATRRTALGAALLLPAAATATAAAAALPLPAVAAEAQVAADASAAASAVEGGSPAAAALDVVSWPQWIDRNFSFAYPPGLREAPASALEQPLPRGAAGAGGVRTEVESSCAGSCSSCMQGRPCYAPCA